MALYVLLLMLGFQIKHFLADYTLQRPFMFAGKGDLRALGGYAHAAVHIAGSLIVLLVAGVGLLLIAGLLAAEFVIHYAVDYTKYHLSDDVRIDTRPALFWAQHGFDQMLHHFTYAGMIAVVLISAGT
jgi:hypothetical protein